MGLNDFRRDRKQFNRLNYRLRTLLLCLSALLIVISIVLAIMIFIYVLNIATNPLNAKVLVDQWSTIFLDNPATPSNANPSPFNGPARWLAVITLIVLVFLLIRIPLLMLQMGTQLMMSCQEDNRQLRNFVRQVLEDLRTRHEIPPPPDEG
jgi:L-asparagine transporter-like permease